MVIRHAALPAFLALYAALYAAFGVQSPYLPSLLQARGLAPGEIGLVLAAGTAIRLVTGPLAGRLADRLQSPGMVLTVCAAAAAALAVCYAPAHGLWPLLVVGILQAASLAPLAPLADTLALGTAASPLPGQPAAPMIDYGSVRGTGSAAFILGSLLSGGAIGRLGVGVIVWLNAALLAVAAFTAARVPSLLPARPAPPCQAADARDGGVRVLLRLPIFRRLTLAASLILGSHAMHDGFAVIRWEAAGIGSGTAGLLWSEQVLSEVVVFLFLGRLVLKRIGPAGAAVLAAATGMVRWAVMGDTAWLPAMMAIEALHGLTFALLHLACMRLIADNIPPHLAATALALYGTAGIGVATVLATLVSGPLYAAFGAQGFWAMAVLCAAALPVAATLREASSAASSSRRQQ
jgi:PPP family 3-phenylpropionic acid transporter